jgi:hypothetical protein
MRVFQGLVYHAKRGFVYRNHTTRDKQYNCYSPCFTGDFGIVDCWVCDEFGNINPDFNCSGVPIDVSGLGAVVNKLCP